MVYTTKFYLIFQEREDVDYASFCSIMREIQFKVRKFKNYASSVQFSYLQNKLKYKEEHGTFPKDEDILNGNNLRNSLYHLATETIPQLNTANASSISEDCYKHFKQDTKKIMAGEKSIASYGTNQPIILHNKLMKLKETEDGKTYIIISLFSNLGKKEFKLSSGQVEFEIWHKCESSQEITHRCVTDEYKVCASSLKYDKNKKMWELAFCYSFPTKENTLDENKILGLDLGVSIPIVAAISNDYKRWFFNGHEIQSFRNKTEAMRKEMLRARVQCGNGSVGHGIKSKVKSVDKLGHRIANFRNTKNHAWAREIINIALKNNCGTIQMEDLSGISSNNDAPKFLKNWTYYDLQQKIKYKAETNGINVVFIDPKNTSRRCSKCGYISPDNRPSQSEFCCQKCGYKENADYNAARNIATKDIDTIIKNYKE